MVPSSGRVLTRQGTGTGWALGGRSRVGGWEMGELVPKSEPLSGAAHLHPGHLSPQPGEAEVGALPQAERTALLPTHPCP